MRNYTILIAGVLTMTMVQGCSSNDKVNDPPISATEQQQSTEQQPPIEQLSIDKDAAARILTEKVTEGDPKLDIVNGFTSVDASSWWSPVDEIDFSSYHDTWIKNTIDGTYSRMDEPYYAVRQIDDKTWQILSDGDYSYLVAGDEIAVMIDSTYGSGNIREFGQSILNNANIDVEVKYIINTHYHFDHTANNAYFDAAFMNANSVAYATRPYSSLAENNYTRNYPIVTVAEGYVLDLGNREIEVIEIGNHTYDGIALLDRVNRILFTGDEFLFSDKVTINVSIEAFAANMDKLMEVFDEYDILCGGPGLPPKTIIVDYYEAAMAALSKEPAYSFSEDLLETKEAVDPELVPAVFNITTVEEPPTDAIVYNRKSVRSTDRASTVPEASAPELYTNTVDTETKTLTTVLPTTGISFSITYN